MPRDVSDFDPFGMLIQERTFSATAYRFGFNGQEKENQISDVDGGHLSFRYRIEDARLGRFLSVDPLSAKYPGNSTYCFAENRVIWAMELEGLEAYYNSEGEKYSDADVKTYLKKEVDKENTNVLVFDLKQVEVAPARTQGPQPDPQIKTVAGEVVDLQMTENQLLNRANWAYGEGGGQLLRHYAHAIKNLSEHGPSKYRGWNSEEEMYERSMTHGVKVTDPETKKTKTEIVNMYSGYFNGLDGSPFAKSFANARKTGEYTPKMEVAIAETIKAKLGTSSDPTNGAWQWKGGGPAKRQYASTTNNYTNKTFVPTDASGNIVDETKAVFFHLFHELKE
jgi:RHS repeat-associated protein